MIIGELSILVGLLLVSIILGCRVFGEFFRKKPLKSIFENQAIMVSLFIVFVLFLMFFVIHFLFCYQIGFPASKTQNNSEHLTLTASDWLGFLSGYLGFAGSLLMSVAVYIQSRDINKLTLAEYTLSIRVSCIDSARSSDYDDKFASDSVAQTYLKNQTLYYAHICEPKENNPQTETETEKVLVFVSITNNSKSTIENLSFRAIEIQELSPEGRCYKFCNKGGKFDPADNKTMILPGRTVKRCFTISSFPMTVENMAWMQFSFICNGGQLLSDKVLFAKTGSVMRFLGCDE